MPRGYVEKLFQAETGRPAYRTELSPYQLRLRLGVARGHEILQDVEAEWAPQLGPRKFSQLRGMLTRL